MTPQDNLESSDPNNDLCYWY